MCNAACVPFCPRPCWGYQMQNSSEKTRKRRMAYHNSEVGINDLDTVAKVIGCGTRRARTMLRILNPKTCRLNNRSLKREPIGAAC
jgi:hypothetical protein